MNINDITEHKLIRYKNSVNIIKLKLYFINEFKLNLKRKLMKSRKRAQQIFSPF